jgi:hypothetical protein
MPELKTKVNDASVAGFLSAIADEQVREDCRQIAGFMESAAKSKPKMWGTSIVGFGESTMEYANGKTAEWPKIAFSPRKQNITLYLALGGLESEELLAKLGKHACGKGCLYIKSLSDVHVPTLKKLIQTSAKKRSA